MCVCVCYIIISGCMVECGKCQHVRIGFPFCVQKASEFFHAKGLSSLPQAFFNGIQLNLEEVGTVVSLFPCLGGGGAYLCLGGAGLIYFVLKGS